MSDTEQNRMRAEDQYLRAMIGNSIPRYTQEQLAPMPPLSAEQWQSMRNRWKPIDTPTVWSVTRPGLWRRLVNWFWSL